MSSSPFPAAGGFHHVALKTRAWDASLAFYTEVLGFTEKIAWGEPDRRAIMLSVGGGGYLEIFEDIAYTPIANGALLHIALRTSDTDAAIARVREAGCKVTMEPKNVDIQTTNDAGVVPVRIAFFQGPNGEVWEFFENELT